MFWLSQKHYSSLSLYQTPSIPNLSIYQTVSPGDGTVLPGDGTPSIPNLWIYRMIFQGTDGFGIARDNCTLDGCIGFFSTFFFRLFFRLFFIIFIRCWKKEPPVRFKCLNRMSTESRVLRKIALSFWDLARVFLSGVERTLLLFSNRLVSPQKRASHWVNKPGFPDWVKTGRRKIYLSSVIPRPPTHQHVAPGN